MRKQRTITRRNAEHPRSGAASVDYVLILCVIFPLAAFAVPAGKRIIQFSYEMICTLFAWPLM